MLELPWLAPGSEVFPPTRQALTEPNGLLAAGTELSPATLLAAYKKGIFPWYDDTQPVLWWSPSPRAVVVPGQQHTSKSLRKFMRSNQLTIRCDTAFVEVMEACAEPRNYTDETWISDEMIEAYTQLHQQGYAHSVECWQGDALVGGLYGIALGSVFFGESMFSRVSNASKAAFIYLCKQLEAADFGLIDCQVENDHLNSLGAELWSREEFESALGGLVEKPSKFCPFV